MEGPWEVGGVVEVVACSVVFEGFSPDDEADVVRKRRGDFFVEG